MNPLSICNYLCRLTKILNLVFFFKSFFQFYYSVEIFSLNQVKNLKILIFFYYIYFFKDLSVRIFSNSIKS